MNHPPSTPAASFAIRRLAAALAATIVALQSARAAEPYALTPADLKLDCKQLTGTIKIRLMAMRQGPSPPSTAVSRGIQSIAAPIFGGTRYGTDEAGQRAADLRLVEAYNNRLVEKNCPSFDLPAALAPGGTGSPSPTIPAKSKPAKSKPAAKPAP